MDDESDANSDSDGPRSEEWDGATPDSNDSWTDRISAGFLTKLTTKTIEKELKKARKLKLPVAEHEDVTSEALIVTEEIGFITAQTVKAVMAYSKACTFDSAEQKTCAAEEHMMAMVIWDWLECSVDHALTQAYDEVPERVTHQGLCHLVLTIKLCAMKGGIQDLQASSFIPEITSSPSYQLNFPSRRELQPSQVRRYAIEALACWFDLADPFDGLARTWFLKEIIREVGVGVLRLAAVIKAIQRVRVSVLEMSKKAVVTQKHFAHWSKTYLSSHPISCSDSPERRLLNDLCLQLDKVLQFNPLLVKRVTDIALRPLPARLEVSLMPAIPAFPNSITLPNASQVRRYWQAMMLCIPLINGSLTVPPPETLHKFPSQQERQAHLYQRFLYRVHTDADNLLPFRNMTPSRVRIRQAGGPFSEGHLRSISGLFSTLVFYGITFGSRFLFDHPNLVFYDLKDWWTVYDNISSKHHARYFCNPVAYRNRTNRKVDDVQKYWEFASQPDNVRWLLEGQGPIKAFELYRKLKAAKLPGLGVLGCIDICLDYAHYGVATRPTSEDMIQMLRDSRKTSPCIAVLQSFGLQDEDLPGGLVVLQALLSGWPESGSSLEAGDIYYSLQCWSYLDQKEFKDLF